MAAMSALNPVFDTSFHSRLLHPKWWGSWCALGLLSLLAFTPARLRERFADLVSPTLLRFSKKQAYIADTNLKICFPSWMPLHGRRCCSNRSGSGSRPLWALASSVGAARGG